MDFIPTEIFSQIFLHLNISDYKCAALVGRKWHAASRDARLMKKVVFRFESSATQKDIESVLTNIRAHNIIFDGFDSPVSTNSSFVRQFPKMFTNVRSLCFRNCDLTPAVFTAMVLECKKLSQLGVTSCNSFFMTGLLMSKKEEVDQLKLVMNNVQELTLSSLKYLSDRILNRFFAVCSSVSELSLAGNSIIFHSGDYYKGISRNGDTCEETANSAVLTFANVIKFIYTCSSHIKVLNFSRTLINGEAMNGLVSIPKLQLDELHLAHCSEISDAAVSLICANQPLLSLLDISECVTVTDKGVTDICKHLLGLKTLRMAKCRQITQLSVSQLHSLQKLVCLDLSSCFLITTNGLKLGLCTGHIKDLTHLKLVACSSVQDSFVVEACKHLRHLVVLDLSSCKIGDKGVLAISYHLTDLQQLSLAWCQDITDSGLMGILDSETHKNMSKIDDEDCNLCRCTRQHRSVTCRKLTVDNPDVGFCSGQSLQLDDLVPISNLKELKSLDLTSCRKLTDASVAKVLKFSHLAKLHLGLMPLITDTSLFAISRNTPSLEEIFLPQCGKITDLGVRALTKNLSRLFSLNVSNCDLLSNQTIEALFNETKGLRHLDVSLCSNITLEAIEMLENNLKHLVTVHKRHVGTRASLNYKGVR